MIQELPDDSVSYRLTSELHDLLVRHHFTEAANLILSREHDRLLVRIMAASTSMLGVLLASLSTPAELGDRDSLTRRITPGEARGGAPKWEYDLAPSRYPIDDSIVFLISIRLPFTDIPAVISRLRQNL
jgi:hypothetical protein